MKHSLWMLAGCVLPLLLIFLLPLLGLGQGAALAIAIVVMFLAHLWMTRGHAAGGCHAGHAHHRVNGNNQTDQEVYHEHAQH